MKSFFVGFLAILIIILGLVFLPSITMSALLIIAFIGLCQLIGELILF